MTPDLSTFDAIVINSSGGKDSQTALRRTVALCDLAGVDRSRLTVAHQDLGKVEWPGTIELVHRQADFYGLPVVVNRYRSNTGEEFDLLEYVRRRGRWPSSQQRYCTSEFKRGPGGRVVTAIANELRSTIARPRILVVHGIRAEESPARRKRLPYSLNTRLTSSAKEVWDWYPIFDWTLEQVWSDIRASGVPHHPAYDQGMPRLSCMFCIFANRPALMVAGRANPTLLDEYCETEDAIGHKFRQDFSIREIRDALVAGELPQPVESWVM